MKKENRFNPGSYSVIASGHNGDIEMTVEFSNEVIKSIAIVEMNETKGISDAPIEKIPKKIIEDQTLNVDTVAGATFTSKAIIAGVTEAVRLADGNIEELQSTDKDEQIAVESEEKCDTLVIGGGAAGISASMRANQLGEKVILLEKSGYLGGANSVSGGNMVVMGSKLQKEEGVTDDSVEIMVEDFLANGDGINNVEILTVFAEEVGKTADWLNKDIGIQFDAGLHVLAEYRKNRELHYTGGGPGFTEKVRKVIADSKIDVKLETKAESLLTDSDGKVVGAKAKNQQGEKITIQANKVILTTGGYGNNPELLSDELNDVLFYGIASSTGDGITMATSSDIDAQTYLMEYGKIYPNGIEVSPGIAKSTIGGNLRVLKENGILVNKNGNRVVNERASNKEILTVLLDQSDNVLYLLLDSKHFEKFVDGVGDGGISKIDIEAWLNAADDNVPVFLKGADLESLAEKANMPKNNLKNTVDKYNGFVEKGMDEDFNRPNEFLQTAVGDGPYYLVEQKPRFATTLGGLKVNQSLNVLNTKNEPIPGLYAAGETVGGVMGSDSPSGANNAWALTSGRVAAEA